MDYRNISGVPTNIANTFLSQTSTLTSDSRIEEALLRSNEPINVNVTEEATADSFDMNFPIFLNQIA